MEVSMLPATLTKSILGFMRVDIPSEKQASSLQMYSLNVAPRHLPIFCICVLEYPAKDRAFAPPLQRECVSIRFIGMPFAVG